MGTTRTSISSTNDIYILIFSLVLLLFFCYIYIVQLLICSLVLFSFFWYIYLCYQSYHHWRHEGWHRIDQSHTSHNAPIPYPTMHHFVTEMCTCVHISVTKWCIVGYLSGALCNLRYAFMTFLLQCTVQPFHNIVNFLQNGDDIHTIARKWGWAVGWCSAGSKSELRFFYVSVYWAVCNMLYGRAHHFPLPNGPGQVKLPVGLVDLSNYF